jgi:hypothetical protein
MICKPMICKPMIRPSIVVGVRAIAATRTLTPQ